MGARSARAGAGSCPELVDDLDGTASEGISTVRFGLDGASYEIDLNQGNAERLRDTLAHYVGAGRRTRGRITRSANANGSTTRPTGDREQTKAVRERARNNGWALADRGRIPANVMTAFDEAHATPAAPKRGRKKK